MGCDIHITYQRKVKDKWENAYPEGTPLDSRDYGIYGFLANVRNYSDVKPISEQRGLPDDYVPDEDEYSLSNLYNVNIHSCSWLSIDELLNFDYDQMTEDRRVTINGDGGCTCRPGEGQKIQKMTYREFLGEHFFNDLELLKAAKVERIVFGFDN
jgi:hypothetical protein